MVRTLVILRGYRGKLLREQIAMLGNGKPTSWPTDLPIKAALNQDFALLKTRSPPAFPWNRTATITFGKYGTGVP
jgi:hypothetical protein